jgi:polyhydroxyalkanoate synthesis regulator phasin
MTHIEALQKIVQLQDLLIAEQKEVLMLMEEVKALSKQIQELQNVF